MDLIYRQGKLFKINDNLLPEKAKNLKTKQELYVALFREFRGASANKDYKDLSLPDRIVKLNEYAKNWLIKQGYK